MAAVQRRGARVVAADGQQILGFAVVGPARDTEGRPPATRPTELRGLYVAQSLLGTGLGQRLLDQVLGPGQSAELWVFDANQRAQSFYRRNGFVPDGSVFRDERFPGLTEIRMAR